MSFHAAILASSPRPRPLQEAGRGYASVKYAMVIPLLLNTSDFITDILFIHKLGSSAFELGQLFFNGALAVVRLGSLHMLCASTTGGFHF